MASRRNQQNPDEGFKFKQIFEAFTSLPRVMRLVWSTHVLTRGKTAIFISHRFSTVRLADRILVLENGQIIEHGSHEELMLLEGRYAELFNLQAEAYR